MRRSRDTATLRARSDRGAKGAPGGLPVRLTGTMQAVAAAAALALATPSGAVDFSAPEGCEAFMTIQSRGCSVSLLWRCEARAERGVWEASFSPEGLGSVVSYDNDYQWLDAAYTWDNSREVFAPPATDPISVSELLATGLDTFDFNMHRATPDRRYDIRVTGADRLTGETVTIDGFEMEEVETRLEIIDDAGETEYASKGTQYYSRELGMFFLGPEEVTGADGVPSTYDDRPIDIILPGEPGFGSTTPLYDCNLQDAAATASPMTAPGAAPL